MSSFKKKFLVDAGGCIDMKNKFTLRFFGVVVLFPHIFFEKRRCTKFSFQTPRGKGHFFSVTFYFQTVTFFQGHNRAEKNFFEKIII